MSNIDSTALQNAVINLDKAYKHFFRRVKAGEKAGFPRWKKRTDPRQSYQSSTAKIKERKLVTTHLPTKKREFYKQAA
jgi:putative transposase